MMDSELIPFIVPQQHSRMGEGSRRSTASIVMSIRLGNSSS